MGKRDHILRKVDDVACVAVLTEWESIDGHYRHYSRHQHFFNLCETLHVYAHYIYIYDAAEIL